MRKVAEYGLSEHKLSQLFTEMFASWYKYIPDCLVVCKVIRNTATELWLLEKENKAILLRALETQISDPGQ